MLRHYLEMNVYCHGIQGVNCVCMLSSCCWASNLSLSITLRFTLKRTITSPSVHQPVMLPEALSHQCHWFAISERTNKKEVKIFTTYTKWFTSTPLGWQPSLMVNDCKRKFEKSVSKQDFYVMSGLSTGE